MNKEAQFEENSKLSESFNDSRSIKGSIDTEELQMSHQIQSVSTSYIQTLNEKSKISNKIPSQSLHNIEQSFDLIPETSAVEEEDHHQPIMVSMDFKGSRFEAVDFDEDDLPVDVSLRKQSKVTAQQQDEPMSPFHLTNMFQNMDDQLSDTEIQRDNGGSRPMSMASSQGEFTQLERVINTEENEDMYEDTRNDQSFKKTRQRESSTLILRLGSMTKKYESQETSPVYIDEKSNSDDGQTHEWSPNQDTTRDIKMTMISAEEESHLRKHAYDIISQTHYFQEGTLRGTSIMQLQEQYSKEEEARRIQEESSILDNLDDMEERIVFKLKSMRERRKTLLSEDEDKGNEDVHTEAKVRKGTQMF